MMPMKIKSIAPWFGGKRAMAPLIARELGPHVSYFEPFCGSLAVLFGKDPASQEMVNDLHGDATNLAWVLQDPDMCEALYERAQRTLFAEKMIREMWKELGNSNPGDQVDADRAYKFFVFSWAMRNGVAGTSRMRGNGFQIALRFTPRGGSSGIRFRNAADSIPAWHQRLRNVVITRRDAFKLLPRFEDTADLAIYADPPYLPETRSGYAAAGATSRYHHEFDHDNPMFGDEHRLLRDELCRFKNARIVISYYDCPRLRKLYAGWTFVDCTRHKNLHVQNGRGLGRRDAPEVLILNGPSFAANAGAEP
jgi:DNA adenine methylase